jgi:saccharopine dehydrogenase (NAD+, L-lysine forming)
MILGIRREDKNKWEKRVPLVPDDIRFLNDKFGIKTLIQPSEIRAFPNEQFKEAGAEVIEDIQNADTIIAVKEIPIDFFREGKTYIFFSHTIKGQSYNMPMLKKMMKLKCNLIDYERVLDDSNKRLIFFGKYAGIAGMIENLHALGQKLKLKGFSTPFEKIDEAYKYNSIAEAEKVIKEIGHQIKTKGLSDGSLPLVFGFAGYGNVSRGAQEVLDLLPLITVKAGDFKSINNFTAEIKSKNLFKVVFEEKDLAKPKSGDFNLQDYYDHPEKYDGRFDDYIPGLTVLVNCIYWDEKYPRLVTKKFLESEGYRNSDKKLIVIGDISCDINGAVEITNKPTNPGDAFYTYFPENGKYENGIQKDGITIMAVDNLPCEFPKESSMEFSSIVKNYIYEIVSEDFNKPYEELSLSNPIKKALILHKGELTKNYHYLIKYLEGAAK